MNKINIRKGLHQKRFTSKDSFFSQKGLGCERSLMQSILSLSVILKEAEKKYSEVSTIFFLLENTRSYNMLKGLLHIYEIREKLGHGCPRTGETWGTGRGEHVQKAEGKSVQKPSY